MDHIAKSSTQDRSELFRLAAGKLYPERSPLIIEKDFWVTWVLYRLYEIIRFRPQLIFKGGTSLSKVYNAIDRFSEDVDLSLSRQDLGFAHDHDPEQPGISKNETRRRIDGLVAACKESICNYLLPALKKDFTQVIGNAGWKIGLDDDDPQTVVFVYPTAGITGQTANYIQPAVRLELGARSDDWPAEEGIIKPYAAEVFLEAFKVASSCRVNTLEADRTFWEKATILHKEYHRPKNEPARERLARHYYDLYQLSKSKIASKALSKLNLLQRVIEHKKVFFRSAWAHYETAIPGSFHLVPQVERVAHLRADYAQMKAMIFGDYPSWEVIVQGLTELEERINALPYGKNEL